MSTGEDPKHGRPTLEFDSELLAKLTRDPEAAPEDAEPALAAGSEPIASPRTATVHDPMTMALLAEVARTSRTVEIDPDKLDEARASSEMPDEPSVHPHVKRR